MLTFKRKLILTQAQEVRIDNWIGTCRFIYNMCLEIRRAAWRNKQENVHKYELSKQLTEVMDVPWIRDVSRYALEDAINRLNVYDHYETFMTDKDDYSLLEWKFNGGSKLTHWQYVNEPI